MKFFQDRKSLYLLSQLILITFYFKNSSCQDLSENTSNQNIIDPHSFYYNRHRKEMQKPTNNEKKISTEMFSSSSSIETSEETMESANCNCDNKLQECRDELSNNLAYEMFSKRLVNMLMSHITFKEEDEIFSGNIYLEATSSQMQVLRDFGNVKVSIRTVDSILSDIIRKPSTTFFDEALSYSELFLSFIQKHKYVCIGILLVISVLFVSRYIRWTRGAIILLVIDLIIVISFFMTWYQLVKEAEIKQTAKQMMYSQMPIECQPEKMNMMQYILSKVSFHGSTEQCEKYVEAMIVDPFVQVTPVQALSHMCTNFILHPLSVAGHVISNFVENATEKLAWPMRWTVTLLLFIGVALLIIVLPFSLFGGSLGFGIGPLFHFTLGRQKEKERVSNAKPIERIELIREVPTNVTIQRIEAGSKRKKSKQVVKQILEKEEEQEQSDSNVSQDSILEKGDSADVDTSTEDVQFELTDKKEKKALLLKEDGSGDR
ncbi:chloride channel CLIC-like protein 1 isoform X1 [Leptopilina heterotoma]|uniref:chloride channel CLIC-like protein 1 isoform X1 n=1 Tax=Leptopilina heterotoma TaxID=63436 RepID=UPI001CA899C4|nr:chloride channel CLIC-like protein 1 isoform X1 [Leptopilina heterotoma]